MMLGRQVVARGPQAGATGALRLCRLSMVWAPAWAARQAEAAALFQAWAPPLCTFLRRRESSWELRLWGQLCQ